MSVEYRTTARITPIPANPKTVMVTAWIEADLALGDADIVITVPEGRA